jgi:hypothetical protein
MNQDDKNFQEKVYSKKLMVKKKTLFQIREGMKKR